MEALMVPADEPGHVIEVDAARRVCETLGRQHALLVNTARVLREEASDAVVSALLAQTNDAIVDIERALSIASPPLQSSPSSHAAFVDGTDGRERPSDHLRPGVEVAVRSRFDDGWKRGFEVVSVGRESCHVRRRSDGAVLPVPFPRAELQLVG
jgi:hypothetical protein